MTLVVVAAALAGAAVERGSTSEVPTPPTTTRPAPTTSEPIPAVTAAPPAATSNDAPEPEPSGRASVDELVVALPDPALPRYERERFGRDWDYDPVTGCNTRERVLAEESVVAPTVDDRCRPSGSWLSVYDGVATTDIADLEIDHLVPLANAWRSGASTWTDERRHSFANDLDQPETLIAVSSRTNRSKSDSTPDQWLPPDRTAWCRYATDWVAVKSTWQLTVTPAEKATLVQVLSGC